MALFLFATLVPLFVGLWRMHHQAVQRNIGVIAGTNVCQLILEQAIASGFDGVDAMAATALADRTLALRTTLEDARTSPPTIRTQSRDYVWTLTIDDSSTDPALMTDEKLVRVSVNWQEGEETRTTSATTILVRNP